MKFIASIVFMLLFLNLPGQYSYDFIKQPNSMTASVAGGQVVSLTHSDLGVWMDNPGLMDSTVENRMSVSINPYFSDIVRYGVSSTLSPERVDQLMVGLIYNSYGTFTAMDAIGNAEGELTARSYILQGGVAHQLGMFSLGASLKYAGIVLSSTSASLALFDIGGVFRHPSQKWVMGLSFRNFGFVINEPTALQTSCLPFDVVAGISFKPQYMPFRLTLTAYDLPRFNQTVVPSSLQRDIFFSPALRYVNPSVSLVVGKFFELQLGYNYRINETMRIKTGGFGAGWSFGMKLLLDKFQILMARITYQAAGGTTFLTLQTNYNTIKNIF